MAPRIPHERSGLTVFAAGFLALTLVVLVDLVGSFLTDLTESLAVIRVTLVLLWSLLTQYFSQFKSLLASRLSRVIIAYSLIRVNVTISPVFILGILLLSTLAIMLLTGRTIWALRRYAHRPVAPQSSIDTPTVSVCIAARNEMHALASCLERVLASDYPKLEILVLDDSSNDDTSLIIKSFAHAGVRFIAGSPLPDDWLGKNHAYQTLIHESSGEYILFLDVDTSINETTITKLMQQLIARKKSMLSVLPRRNDSQHLSAVFGTMRYYWELLLGTKKSPPAASALWLVERAKLKEAGVGLENYGMSVRPERHLARQLQRGKDYYYLIGDSQLAVGFEKRLKSQYETAFRLYYPMTGRKMVYWLLASLFLGLLIAPLLLVVVLYSSLMLIAWAIGLVVLLAFTFGLYTLRTSGGFMSSLRVLLGPLLAIQELVLLFVSHIKYRLGSVSWKGRLVAAQPTKRDAISVDE